MKWIVLKDKDVALEMNIIYFPYLLYDLPFEWTRLDPDWTAVSIVLKKKKSIIFRDMYREALKTDEVISIAKTLSQLVDGKLDHHVSLRFCEPCIEIDMFPESEKAPVVMNIVNANNKMNLSIEDAISLHNYLSYISGSIYSNDERIKDMQKRKIIYDEWRWFPVAKAPGGKKVFVLPVEEWWHEDDEECVTIWYKPLTYWYEYQKAPAYWGVLKNCEVKKVYLPKILYEANLYNYWGNTEEDYRIACRYADMINEEDKPYSEVLQTLAREEDKRIKG